jgi:predicted Rdx family selenoprotein
VEVANAITKEVPNCKVVYNMVPKNFAMSDIYCQLVHNSDDSNPFYDVVPRIGSFEISINGVLLFSKSLSGIWPNYIAIADKARKVAEALAKNQDIAHFQTSGKVGVIKKIAKPEKSAAQPAA